MDDEATSQICSSMVGVLLVGTLSAVLGELRAGAKMQTCGGPQ